MSSLAKLSCAAAMASLLCASCASTQSAVKFEGGPQAFELLQPVPEAETTKRAEQRKDLYVTVTSGEPVPFVVGQNTIGPINRQGGRAKLYGDKEGRMGWNVDNFILLEISRTDGTLIQRLAIGFQQGVSIGSEQIDTVGPMQFQFGPGEIDLTRFLPENEPVNITATALDTGSTGTVSAVYLILSADRAGSGSGADDFRD